MNRLLVLQKPQIHPIQIVNPPLQQYYLLQKKSNKTRHETRFKSKHSKFTYLSSFFQL